MPMLRLTRAVKSLLIVSFVVFLIQQTADLFFGAHFLLWFGLVPSIFSENHAYWQLFTYSFLNRDITQLFFNLLMLAFIGSELEAVWGYARFLKYYFFCATTSAAFYLLIQLGFLHGMSAGTPMIGASGALYGLLAAYGVLFGERVLLFMMLFPMKAKHFVWLLGLIELLTTFYSAGGAAPSFALLGGMVAGLLYLWVLSQTLITQRTRASGGGKGTLSQRLSHRWKKRSGGHLKLIVNNDRSRRKQDDDESEGGKPKTWH